MWRTAILLGGRARKAPTVRARVRPSQPKRVAASAANVKRQTESAALRQFLKVVSDARKIRHRQIRVAIKLALAKQASEKMATRRDERYAKNRDRAATELVSVESEKAVVALKTRKQAALVEAAEKKDSSIAVKGAKKKIEREVRAARIKASEEAAEEGFLKLLQKAREKRDAQVQVLVEKSVAREARQDAQAAAGDIKQAAADIKQAAADMKTAAQQRTEEPKLDGDAIPVDAVEASPPAPPPKPARKPAAKRTAPRVPAGTTETVEMAAAPAVPPTPAAPPPPAAKPRRPRRPATPPPVAATAAVAATVPDNAAAQVHDEFVAQLEKAKDRATVSPPAVQAPSPPSSAPTPAKGWTMPESSTGLFRL